jgi:5-methyltetrahydrofolate--homocysteine methyltransferase
MTPLDIINNEIIPALDEVGIKFEEKQIYLPQLLMSAECSSKAFSIIKEKMPVASDNGKGVIMATVKGDIHDIGKNIVKLLLESYGFTVFDLGKDVAPQTILEAVKKYNCNVVGLSALMTTTLPAMKETISLLKSYDKNIKVMVGGAVLTEEYAEMINADMYAKDAMNAVKYLKKLYE